MIIPNSSQNIFKAYDVRGVYPSDINAGVAETIAKALKGHFEAGSLIIAHDGRHGGIELDHVFSSVLNGGQHTIINVGLSTTPMFYFLVHELEAAGGIMVTASHNPKEYNGLKIVGRNAIPISGTEIKKLVERL